MGTIGTSEIILYMEVSLIQGLNNTGKYYCGARISVLIRRVSFIQRVFNREVSLYSVYGVCHGCSVSVFSSCHNRLVQCHI